MKSISTLILFLNCYVSYADFLPVLCLSHAVQPPSIYAVGVQFDATNIFVTDLTKNGQRCFFESSDGGENWESIIICKEKTSKPDNSYRVFYYNQKSAIYYYNQKCYFSQGSNYFVKSVCVSGQDGFCLASLRENGHYDLLRSYNGGRSWLQLNSKMTPFDYIDSFDVNSTNLFICAHVNKGKDQHNVGLIELSKDNGKSWNEIYNSDAFLEKGIDLLPNHVFFLNEKAVWISSDKDEGLFFSQNGGKIWNQIKTPERIINGIFFKDIKHGRIIGGVSNNIYETENGGQSWRILSNSYILSSDFLVYFQSKPLSRSNNFYLHQTLLKSNLNFQTTN